MGINSYSRIKGKKAVSPLIATVLLIAFSVALGAVVMNWGRSFVGDQTKKVDTDSEVTLKCSVDILLDFVEINNLKQVCHETNGNLRVIVQNLGSQNATGVSIRFIDDSGNVFTYGNYSGDLAAGAARKYVVTNATVAGGPWGPVSYVSVSPTIRYPGSSLNQICAGNKVEVSTVGSC